MDLRAFLNLLIRGPSFLTGLQIKDLEFDNLEIVCFLIAGILSILIFKFILVIFGHRKHHRKISGHGTLKVYGIGLFKRLLRFVVPSLLVIPLAAFLMALAGGHKNISSVEFVQSEFRQQMVLLDCSVSIGWESNQPKKAWAELLRDGYIELLKLRASKKDRVSLWIFSQKPYLITDFVNDTDFLRDKVLKAPYVLIDPGTYKNGYSPQAVNDSRFPPLPRVILPEDKLKQLPGEGGTNLATALREMINYLDREIQDNKANKVNTTFIVVTDGAPDLPVDQELMLLKKKQIKLLVLYMHNSTYDSYLEKNGPIHSFGIEAAKKSEQAKKFQADVKKYGGRFYVAANAKEVTDMYRQIDEQEAVKYTQKIHKDRQDFSESFLMFGTSSLFFIIIIGLFFSIRKGTSP